MNKTELITKIAADAGIPKTQAAKALHSFCDSVVKTLKKGDKIALIGFGTFQIMKRKARKARNPKSGETIKIKAKKVVKFKPGKQLSESVNI